MRLGKTTQIKPQKKSKSEPGCVVPVQVFSATSALYNILMIPSDLDALMRGL